ncbi:MAG: hypothetical protein HFJ81_01810 [Clostridia bacterium]|nr:hypothetical protein [Clostridia bacterium]
MPYIGTKVYSDGSHYIAIPPENFPSKQRKRNKPKPKPTTKPKTDGTPPTTPKEKFETAYKESQALPKRERKKYIADKLKAEFKTAEQVKEFVDNNMERKKNNAYKRYTRLWRKVHLQKEWNFFVTFTYSDEKLTETQFKAKLRNTLKHAVNRNGWKYIGVWERAPETGRLHFHGIFYIPQMIGEIVEVKDYSTKSHRMQTTYQNTHFLKEFGRNDFKQIEIPNDISQSVKYLLKYIEKSGEKLVYGGKLPTYFKSDILDEDIACGFGVDEKKLLLFDNFECIDEGVLMGKVSPEVIEQMPKAN